MLHQKLADDLKNAMKSGGSFQVGVLRMLLSAIHNKEIEKKGKGQEPVLSDDEIADVLFKESKKRKEATEIYSKAGRADLSEKEIKELEIIKKYLPEQLGEEEIEKAVKAAIEKVGAKDIKDFGKVMAEAMKELKGRADASSVSEMVKKNL
ncbi:MAG: GatB/YqeY domain-containing protein [bacterium]|nr:GatB/YqeY domain-containing protein [bacterium]